MSTRSNIVLVLKEEDYGKVMKFNPVLVGKPMSESYEKKPCEFDTPEVSIEGKKFMYIYHHWDGYPECLGETLLNEFNDYDKILNLLLAGDESSINGDSICPYHAWRNEDWESVKPEFTDECPFGDLFIEYVYKFENGLWYVKEGDYNETYDWKLLTDVLEDLNKENE